MFLVDWHPVHLTLNCKSFINQQVTCQLLLSWQVLRVKGRPSRERAPLPNYSLIPVWSWRTVSLLTGDFPAGNFPAYGGVRDSAGHSPDSREPLYPHLLHSHTVIKQQKSSPGRLPGRQPDIQKLQEDSSRALGGCHPLKEEFRLWTLTVVSNLWTVLTPTVYSLTISFVLVVSIYYESDSKDLVKKQLNNTVMGHPGVGLVEWDRRQSNPGVALPLLRLCDFRQPGTLSGLGSWTPSCPAPKVCMSVCLRFSCLPVKLGVAENETLHTIFELHENWHVLCE